MPVDLQDENTQPNPIIRKLIDIGSDLFLLSIMDGPDNQILKWQYKTAADNVALAISCLMEVKNTIAREQGEDAAPGHDACQICKGAKGGMPGNENIIDGIVMCDYCHAERIAQRQGTDA